MDGESERRVDWLVDLMIVQMVVKWAGLMIALKAVEMVDLMADWMVDSLVEKMVGR